MVKEIRNDAEFAGELERAEGRLVVVDFYATWCGPCQNIAPHVARLSKQYADVVFLKVDVDVCQGTAATQRIEAMPTFLFFVSNKRVDMLRGADPNKLEAKIKEWAESLRAAGGGSSGNASAVEGQLDLLAFITRKDCECLNESDDHTLKDLFGGGSLTSDCDEQLIISIPFNQPVKIHSIAVTGPPDSAPKSIKLFINQPKTLDFDQAAHMTSTQTLELDESTVTNGDVINLRFVKFQSVQNLQLFIPDNLGGSDVTTISALKLYGTPVGATNMSDFKRVAGKKGEAH